MNKIKHLSTSATLGRLASTAVLAALPVAQAWACASCGCSLNSDWGILGSSGEPSWSVDIRYDQLDQNQLRTGTGTISPTAAASVMNPTTGGPAEVERYTHNQYLTTTLDYNQGQTWGLSLVIPYIMRDHSTLGTGSDGVTPGSGQGGYDSSASGLGDVRLLARYYGFSEEKNFGIQYGVKLPTGYTGQVANDGVTPVDPGLQLGTGTFDAIVGAYYLGNINQNFDYFLQGSYQLALDTATYGPGGTPAGTYRPGNSVNLTAGSRYHGFDGWIPEIQLNYHVSAVDSGTAADLFSTGGTLLYFTPGVTIPLDNKVSVRANVQIPLYQNLNGIQLAPTAIYSVGVHVRF